MLTTLQANFIQEFKQTGSPTKALRNIGYKAKETSLPTIAYRWMRKPEIRKAIDEYTVNLRTEIHKPVLSSVNPLIRDVNPINVITIPTKDQYVQTAWDRASDGAKLKEDTKYKYFENAGKVLGYIGKESSEGEKPLLQMVIGELNITEIIGHEKTPSLENPASDFVIDQAPNTPLPPSDNTHGTHQEDKGFDVVPILNGSSLEKSEGLAGGGQGPQEGESISVNPLPNPPTILNSVNGENTRV